MKKVAPPLNIFMLSSDWRNLFETDFDELYKKLERDRLHPEKNNFFFFAWAHTSFYKKRDDRFASVHKSTRWQFFRPFLDIASFFVVPRAFKKYDFKPDIILVYDFGLLPTAHKLKKRFGGVVVLCLTTMGRVSSATRTFGALRTAYSAFLERAFKKLPDYVYTINQTTKDYLISAGIDEKKITIFASDTIQRDMRHINASRTGVIREKYGLSNSAKILLSVGRLETEKDFPRLFALFASLGKEYYLVVLGQGSLKASLETRAKELHINDRVIFTGFVGRDEIWNYYQDADTFILLSKAEALGLVFWEAMYMGVPVIGSIAPGILETIGKDGERGRILYEREPVDASIRKLNFCIEASKERDEMLVRSKEYIELQIQNQVDINTLIV